MELPKQIYEALAKIASFEELEAFLRVSTIKGTAGKSKFNLFNYVSDDDKIRRESFKGVYHDPNTELAVATDSLILVTSAQLYKPELAGQIIKKSGESIKDKIREQNEEGVWVDLEVTPQYPDYREVINRVVYSNQYEILIPTISEHYKNEVIKYEAQRKAKKRKPVSIYIGFKFDRETVIWFNYKVFNKFLTACEFLNATSICYKDPRTAVFAETKNGTAVICPVRVETDEQGNPTTDDSEECFVMLNNPNEEAPDRKDNLML